MQVEVPLGVEANIEGLDPLPNHLPQDPNKVVAGSF